MSALDVKRGPCPIRALADFADCEHRCGTLKRMHLQAADQAIESWDALRNAHLALGVQNTKLLARIHELEKEMQSK